MKRFSNTKTQYIVAHRIIYKNGKIKNYFGLCYFTTIFALFFSFLLFNIHKAMLYTKDINQIRFINISSRTQYGSTSRKGPIARYFGCGCRMDDPCFDMLFDNLSEIPQGKNEIKIMPGAVNARLLPWICRKPYPALKASSTVSQNGT